MRGRRGDLDRIRVFLIHALRRGSQRVERNEAHTSETRATVCKANGGFIDSRSARVGDLARVQLENEASPGRSPTVQYGVENFPAQRLDVVFWAISITERKDHD